MTRTGADQRALDRHYLDATYKRGRGLLRLCMVSLSSNNSAAQQRRESENAIAQKTLITGGIVYFVDHEIGILPEGDVIVDGDTIVDIGLNLADLGAEIINARGMVVTPGVVDSHRHTWQTVLRQVGSHWTPNDHIALTIGSLAPTFRAVDIRTGNLLGALRAIDSGFIILMDWSHIANSPDLADAALHGLRASRIRAAYGYGFPTIPAALLRPTSLIPTAAPHSRLPVRVQSSSRSLKRRRTLHWRERWR
ncbi:hypothetical protein [Salinibacterium sp.]|uniref:hypothetical protein n=1 Tax=Salinibacterium sp. TaxID=1915057 RepID=UPI00286C1578|nr:hypothetical protein [Salinibacterium sp.]